MEGIPRRRPRYYDRVASLIFTEYSGGKEKSVRKIEFDFKVCIETCKKLKSFQRELVGYRRKEFDLQDQCESQRAISPRPVNHKSKRFVFRRLESLC